MYMHCFFKFLARVNPRINSLTFKTENTRTLDYNFSFLMKIRLRHRIDLPLAFLIQYFSFLSISQQNLHTTTPDKTFQFIRSLVTRHLIGDGVLETSRFLVQLKTDQHFLNAKVDLFFTHKLFEASSIINSTNLPSHY